MTALELTIIRNTGINELKTVSDQIKTSYNIAEQQFLSENAPKEKLIFELVWVRNQKCTRVIVKKVSVCWVLNTPSIVIDCGWLNQEGKILRDEVMFLPRLYDKSIFRIAKDQRLKQVKSTACLTY